MCGAVPWLLLREAFDTSNYVNQSYKMALTDADMVANAGEKDHTVVTVVAVHFLLSAVPC